MSTTDPSDPVSVPVEVLEIHAALAASDLRVAAALLKSPHCDPTPTSLTLAETLLVRAEKLQQSLDRFAAAAEPHPFDEP